MTNEVKELDVMENELTLDDLDNVAGGAEEKRKYEGVTFMYHLEKNQENGQIYVMVTGTYQSGRTIRTQAFTQKDFERFRANRENEGAEFYKGFVNPVQVPKKRAA